MIIKDAYIDGFKLAVSTYTGDTPPRESWLAQVPTTTPEGQGSMIDQAFQTNAALGEDGQAAGGLPSATNPTMAPSLPPVGTAGQRYFTSPTETTGDDLPMDDGDAIASA